MRTGFDLVKLYGAGEKRRITRPAAGSVRVAIDGTEKLSGWSLDSLGVVQFDEPPNAGSVIAAGFLFDVPVRFAEDRIEVNRATFLPARCRACRWSRCARDEHCGREGRKPCLLLAA